MNSFTATDPTDKSTAPRQATEQVQIKLGVGDRSTSHSEDYVLNVFRIDPATGAEQRIHTLRSGGFGQYAEIYKSFKIGETYTFQIQWVGTNKHAITTGTIEGPDWDYHLVVAPQGTDTGGTIIDSYAPAKKTIDTAAPILDPGDETPESDDNDNVANFPNTHQAKRVVFLSAALTPDWNRDGQIDAADRGQATTATPWRFWINDDNDSGETGGTDIPQGAGATGTNAADAQANGTRDLVDFFPVFADLRAAFHLLPPNKYYYRFTQAEAAHQPALRLIFADDLTAAASSAYLKVPAADRKVAYAQSRPLNPYGPLPTDGFLSAVRDGKGLLLVEGIKPTTIPMVLKIQMKPENTTVFTSALPVSISGVEAMFRQKYLADDLFGGTQGGVPANPPNWPDAECNGKHFVMVHGYAVSADEARGTFSDFFKKLFWSGSKAMFTGVAWHGNESQIPNGVPFLGGNTPDYWRNVPNAFLTAPSMNDFVTALPGASKHIAAHSLGNMVVSSAIADHGLAVENYFMLDAAVPVEAYSAGAPEEDNMIHPAWRGTYDPKLRASDWYKLFPLADGRHGLTWRGRFGAFPNAYNFHSTGEEVLRNSDGPVPTALDVATSLGVLAWAKNELSKGEDLLGGGGLVHQGNGGWEFNEWWLGTRLPEAAALLTDAQIQSHPYFKPFWLAALTDPTHGSAAANDLDNRALTLAEAIPATTYAAGANPIPSFPLDRNIDMPTLNNNGWPVPRANDQNPKKRGWRHGDYRDVAFLYTYGVYEKITELANLNQTNNQ